MANIESATSELSDARANGLKLLHRLCMRRSTPPRHLTAPGPTDEEIQLLARAASRAPDHQRLKPFRFLIISSDDREALADVFEAAERELDPSIGGERLERAREKARHAPVLVAVISRLQKSDEVPEIEQRASAGAALGYVVLAADLLDTRHSDFDGLEWSRAGLDAAFPADGPAGMAWANLSVPACAAYQSPSQT